MSRTFTDWCVKNSNRFWRKNQQGVAVALSDVSLPVFREISKIMSMCHRRDTSSGNLVDQVVISENSVSLRSHPTQLSSYPDPDAQVVKDLKAFSYAVHRAVRTTLPHLSPPPPAVDCFQSHFGLLKKLDQNSANLKNYEFLLRNSPLLLSSTGKLLLFRKVLSLSEFDPRSFFIDVDHFKLIEPDWSQKLSYPELIAIRDFDQQGYTAGYRTIRFYRNCLGHIRDNERRQAIWSDERILLALEDELPHVMPLWYHALLQLKPEKCISHCGYSFANFLRRHPSVFT